MSERLGLATFEEPRQSFLGAVGPAPREYMVNADQLHALLGTSVAP